MRRENAKKQGSIVSLVTLRNLLFLVGGALFLLLPSARRAFGLIVECTGCSCDQFSIGFPAMCSAYAYCSPESLWIVSVQTADYECGNNSPTTTHFAETNGLVGRGDNVYGQNTNHTVYGECPGAWTLQQCDGYQTGGSTGSDLCCYP